MERGLPFSSVYSNTEPKQTALWKQGLMIFACLMMSHFNCSCPPQDKNHTFISSRPQCFLKPDIPLIKPLPRFHKLDFKKVFYSTHSAHFQCHLDSGENKSCSWFIGHWSECAVFVELKVFQSNFRLSFLMSCELWWVILCFWSFLLTPFRIKSATFFAGKERN